VTPVTVAAIVAVAAAALAVLASVAALLALRRLRNHGRLLEREIDRGKAEFDAVVGREIAERSTELQQTLARVRADSLSQLAEEERRIAEERRRDVAERERDASARLSEQLVAAQQGVERRLRDWSSDIERLQGSLADELKRIEATQRQLMNEVAARIGQDAEGLQSQIDEQRGLIARLRADLDRAASEVLQQASAELEQHAAERRRALQEVAERLRKREHDLQEFVEREGAEVTQRIQIALGDIERRQVEQLQRVVAREATRYSESASEHFEATVRTAREEAARRLGRELDLAVERFAREAESVLAERVNHVSDAAAQRVEERLSRLRSNLERQRDEALASLEGRAHEVEAGLRDRLREIAAEAESERAILDQRLHELARRLDELAARA
jgi:uncharacterized protein YukE